MTVAEWIVVTGSIVAVTGYVLFSDQLERWLFMVRLRRNLRRHHRRQFHNQNQKGDDDGAT